MIFKDRKEAGEILAEELRDYEGRRAVVLAIPRGGVPIAYAIAKRIDAKIDLIIPRKLPIPYSPEAGFGAIAPDGTIVLNSALVEEIGLSQEEIQNIADEVLEEVKRREKEYGGAKKSLQLEGKVVIIVDDGLASGFTMIAAIESVKKQKPKEIVVAVPVSPKSSIKRIEPLVDKVICLFIKERGPFAVASFYEDFKDLTDKEVKWYLQSVS